MSVPIALYVRAWSAGSDDPIELYRTPAGRLTGLTPVGLVEITRARRSALDGPDAGAVTLTIQAPATAPVLDLGYDDRIEVAVTLPGDPDWYERVVVVCWVQSWTRHVAGRIATYVVQCQDAIGRLGGWLVGDTPWPDQSVTQRVTRLNQLAGEAVLDPIEWDGGGDVAGRDVDNRSLLDLIQLMSPDMVVPVRSTVVPVARPGIVPGPPNDWGPGAVIDLPGRAVVDAGMVMSRADRVSVITVTAPPPNGGEPIHHRHTAPTAGPSSTYTIESDRWGATGYFVAGAVRTADVTRVQLAPTRVLVDRAGAALGALIAPSPWGEVLYLDGVLPAGHYRSQILMGVTLRVEGGTLHDIEVELLPATAAGVVRLTWAQLPLIYPDRERFGPPMHTGVRPQPDPSVTWRKTRATRILPL